MTEPRDKIGTVPPIPELMPAMYAATAAEEHSDAIPNDFTTRIGAHELEDFNTRVLRKVAEAKGESYEEARERVYHGKRAAIVIRIGDLSPGAASELMALTHKSGGPVMFIPETPEETIQRWNDEDDNAFDARTRMSLHNMEMKPGYQAAASVSFASNPSEAKEHIRSATRDAAKPGGFKDNNPKDAFGTLKAGVTSFLYGPVLAEMALGMAAGAFKYGAHNYLCVAPRSSVYTDAAIRHILAYVSGEDLDPDASTNLETGELMLDPETGEYAIQVSHITAAINSLHVLRSAMINGGFVDDRPPPAPKGWLSRTNKGMVALAKLFPNPVARYLAGGQRGPGRVL